MVVVCPKCKVKLKIPDEKIAPQGSRFKCPKCTTILNVKKPAEGKGEGKRELDKNKVMISSSNENIIRRMTSLLTPEGFTVISSPDGVDTMVKASQESPYTVIVDSALPKIYGHEISKRIKTNEELKGMRVLLFTSVHDKHKYRREPTSLYGADDYIEDHQIESELLRKVRGFIAGVTSHADTEKTEPSQSPAESRQDVPPPSETVSTSPGTATENEEWANKAGRLTRTMLADIFLYNPQKAEEALKNGNFRDIFVAEINEGRKLYESRIPKDVRDQKDYFSESIEHYLNEKKKNLSA